MREEYPRLGTLEHQVMDVLWDCADELCVRRVLERLATTTLAYTTVATVLTNLLRKGMVERTSTVRSWAYRPTMPRSEYVAGCMLQTLRSAEDRAAVLQELVRRLGPAEHAALRRELQSTTSSSGPTELVSAAATDDGAAPEEAQPRRRTISSIHTGA